MSVSEQIALRFAPLMDKHLPDVMAIEREAYPEPWPTHIFRQEIRSKLSCFHVAFSDDTLIGFAGFWRVADEAHITSVTLRRDYRGRGLGRRLLIHLLDEATRLGIRVATLEVRASNYPARKLYRSFGFQNVGRREGYYSRTDEDAIVMARDLVDWNCNDMGTVL